MAHHGLVAPLEYLLRKLEVEAKLPLYESISQMACHLIPYFIGPGYASFVHVLLIQ